MAIGRITGQMLSANLARSGTDLAFETNLLALDVSNSRVGVGTASPATTLHVSATDSVRIASGTTAQRPGSPAHGDLRYNSTLSTIEGYSNSAWANLASGDTVKDADEDTKIQVEESSDEDIIRFDAGGSEIMTSGTFNSTGLYGAITPSATDSKVLAIAVTSGTYNNGSTGMTYAIYRGTTGEGSGSAIFTAEIVGSSGGQHYMATAMKLDSPSSTSANTYTVMHKSSNGSSLVGWCSTEGDGDDAGKLILIEIGA